MEVGGGIEMALMLNINVLNRMITKSFLYLSAPSPIGYVLTPPHGHF